MNWPSVWPIKPAEARWFGPAAWALGWLAGTLVLLWASRWPDPRWVGWAGGAALLASLGLRRARVSTWGAAVLIVAGVLGGWSRSTWDAQGKQAEQIDAALIGVDLRVQGLISDLPRVDAQASRFRLDVEQAWLDGRSVRLPARIDLAWYAGWQPSGEADLRPAGPAQRAAPTLSPGERWLLQVRLKPAHGGVNPHGADFELWAWENDLGALGYVRSGAHDPPAQRLASGLCCRVAAWRAALRERIWAQGFEPRTAGVLAALVLGDQASISRDDWDVFRATGVAHLMSISGLHITLWAWLAGALIGALWRRWAWACARWPAQHAAGLGGLLLATGYALFAGWGIPAQRTLWMLGLFVGLRLRGVHWPWAMRWLAAAWLVALVDPWALLQPGFWLSFVAVGVLIASDSGAAYASQTGVWSRFRAMLAEQKTVSLALAPLSLVAFGQVSLIGLGVNLLAIPLVSFVITPLALLGVLLSPAWALAALLIEAFTQTLSALALWPGAVATLARAPLWAGVAAVVAGAGLAAPLAWRWRAWALLGLVPLLGWRVPTPPAGVFELWAADVGQGHALLVRTAQHTLIYDTGPRYSAESDAGSRVLVPLLQALGWSPDAVVLSHRDSDHTGGYAALRARWPAAPVWAGFDTPAPAPQARAAAPTPIAPTDPPFATQQRCQAGQHWVWDGVLFEMLHPLAEDDPQVLRPNAMSCVLRIQAASGVRALLVGDIEAAQEARLLRDHGSDLHAQLLLVPHHGSRTSSSAAFLAAVQPRHAWVQAGYRNRYGHPTGPVLARYQAIDAQIWRTDTQGALHWRSDQAQLVHTERDAQRRLWRHFDPPAAQRSQAAAALDPSLAAPAAPAAPAVAPSTAPAAGPTTTPAAAASAGRVVAQRAERPTGTRLAGLDNANLE